jgi:hypothetical protein
MIRWYPVSLSLQKFLITMFQPIKWMVTQIMYVKLHVKSQIMQVRWFISVPNLSSQTQRSMSPWNVILIVVGCFLNWCNNETKLLITTRETRDYHEEKVLVQLQKFWKINGFKDPLYTARGRVFRLECIFFRLEWPFLIYIYYSGKRLSDHTKNATLPA